MRSSVSLSLSLLALTGLSPFSAVAETSDAELAKQALNPVAALYSLPIQYNWDQGFGPTNDGTRSLTNIQPVLPFDLNEDWNLISRTVLPVINQQGALPSGLANASGTGDTTQSFFFSPKAKTADGWIWGAGPAILAPTGSDDLLTSDQWALGPTAVALKQEDGWTYGVLANHLWTLNNNPPDGKEKINNTYMQPFLVYTTHTFTSFGINTETNYNWEAKNGQEWSVPINLFVTQIFKIGNQPMSIQAGPRYWADSPDNGAEGWGFRVAYTLMFPR